MQVERRVYGPFEVHCQQPVTLDSWVDGVLGGYIYSVPRCADRWDEGGSADNVHWDRSLGRIIYLILPLGQNVAGER